jgi:hypothetical protein
MNTQTPVRDGDGNTVSLREYIERIFDERDKAVQVAWRTMEMRLDKLNELRAEVTADRGQFLRTDVYEERHETLRKAVSGIEDRMRLEIKAATASSTARIDNLESWRLKATGVFLVLVPLAGIIGAAITKAFGS